MIFPISVKHLFSVICVVALGCVPLASANAASAFDGNWAVTLTCDSAKGAMGYTFRFPAKVVDGVLNGENGERSSGAWLALRGPIKPDGSAYLFAEGLTGSPDYAVKHPNRATPYNYHVEAHFDAAQGSGKRVELRPCDFRFRKTS
jgi:hypothetical protein